MIAKIGWFWVELADLNRIRKIPFQKSMQIYNDKNYNSTLFSLFLGRFEPIWEGSEDGQWEDEAAKVSGKGRAGDRGWGMRVAAEDRAARAMIRSGDKGWGCGDQR